MMNKADPRVDSDRLGTVGNTAGVGGVGAGQYTESHGSGLTGHSTTGHGLGSSTGNTMGTGMTGGHGTADFNDPSGPHGSRMANQADPRVGGVGSTGTGAYNTTGSGVTGHSTTGGLGHSDPTGPHSSHAANTADPRVGGGVGSTGIGGTGHHTSTTGEHGSVPGHVEGTVGRGDVAQGGYASKSELPKALVEPQSHAVPHSSIRDDHQHVSGQHGTSDVHGKPSMMDKLNPKKDADHDGKRGIMD
ncbi:hypothetical protein PtrEW4_003043 [Pyrenophora tritici-repentis]|nr:hypothetical protein PtrEW4_003043 [Pyrenophora tritici-repentis]